jgi:hypothetical protein
MKKKVIILQHGGGELANQLWNFVSIYAYCLEKKFNCQNYSFFEYGDYFDIPLENNIINFIFFKPFKNHHKRRNNFKNKFWRFIYKIYEKTTAVFLKKRIISSVNSKREIFYLPPTKEIKKLSNLEKDEKPIYFIGWLFRNPEGLKRFRKEIIKYFRPKNKYIIQPEAEVKKLRKKYKNVIGVHIRQGDYKTFKGGKYFIPQNRVIKILKEYLSKNKKKSKETIFMITSDGKIDEKIFSNINFKINHKSPIEDLYLLSLCDTVIGSDSSFGNFAAFYGNKPHIIMKNNYMDWGYYEKKEKYFYNKYCTMVNF